MKLEMKSGNDLAVSRMHMVKYFSSLMLETVFIKCKVRVLN
jgi:hypothetical protein